MRRLPLLLVCVLATLTACHSRAPVYPTDWLDAARVLVIRLHAHADRDIEDLHDHAGQDEREHPRDRRGDELSPELGGLAHDEPVGSRGDSGQGHRRD